MPLHFRGSLVVRIVGTSSDEGVHEFRLRILNEDGKPIAPDISGSVRIPLGGGGAVFVADFALVLPGYGRYTFSLLVDRHELDTCQLRAVESEAVHTPVVRQPTLRTTWRGHPTLTEYSSS